MKQKDLITVVATVFVVAIFSFVICNNVIFTNKDRSQQVEVIKPITADFELPDKKIFNPDAIDPTKLIEIGPNTNDQPFANQ